MKNIVFVAMSLDGFIAENDGTVDFLESAGPGPEGEDFGWADFFKNIDALVMGRNTYDVLLGFDFWPYEDKKVVIITNRDIDVADDLKDRVSSFSGTPDEIIDHLKSMNCQNLYIDGGSVIQQFIGANLIDEMIITIIPILIGDDIPLFGNLPKHLKLKSISTKQFKNGLVQLHYRLIN